MPLIGKHSMLLVSALPYAGRHMGFGVEDFFPQYKKQIEQSTGKRRFEKDYIKPSSIICNAPLCSHRSYTRHLCYQRNYLTSGFRVLVLAKIGFYPFYISPSLLTVQGDHDEEDGSFNGEGRHRSKVRAICTFPRTLSSGQTLQALCLELLLFKSLW